MISRIALAASLVTLALAPETVAQEKADLDVHVALPEMELVSKDEKTGEYVGTLNLEYCLKTGKLLAHQVILSTSDPLERYSQIAFRQIVMHEKTKEFYLLVERTGEKCITVDGVSIPLCNAEQTSKAREVVQNVVDEVYNILNPAQIPPNV